MTPMGSEDTDPRGAIQSFRVAPWPITKAVGVTGPDLLRSGGQLIITPGTLACVQHRPLGDNITVVHDSNSVDVYTARLMPPWFNVTVPVRGKGGLLVASMWIPRMGRSGRNRRNAVVQLFWPISLPHTATI